MPKMSNRRIELLQAISKTITLDWFLMMLNPKHRGPVWKRKMWHSKETIATVARHAIRMYGINVTFKVTPATDEIVEQAAKDTWFYLVNSAGLLGKTIS